MKRFSITNGIPVAIWYAFAILTGAFYTVFYAQMGRLWVFALAYWVLVAAFLYCFSKVQPFDIFNPLVGLIVLLFLYSFASGLFLEEFGAVPAGEPVSDWTIGVYYVCCLTGLGGLTMGALLASPVGKTFQRQRYARSVARRVRANPIFTRRLIFWSVALGLTFASVVAPQFNPLHVSAYSERAFALRVERAQVANSGVDEVLFARLPAIYILCATTVLTLAARNKLVRLGALSIFLAYVMANTLAGWRGTVIAAMLIPAVYYHYRIKALSVRFALIGGISVYLFVNALSAVRITSNPVEMVTLLRENVGANGFAFASLSSSGELLVGTNLAQLISGIQSGQTEFTYGKSVLTGILAFIPRSVYAGRPLSLAEKFVDVFYPGVLESGGGRGLFILQDGYWALGIPGVFVFMLAYGWVVQRLYLWFTRHLTNDLAVLAYSAIYGAIVMGAVRTGVVSSVKGAFVNALPFAVLWLLLTIRLPTGRWRTLKLPDESAGVPSVT